jgi:threonine dehydrogenase-like Zn-dependent dehydrogenase
MIGEVSMSETRRSFLESTLATAALAGMSRPANAQAHDSVTIGIIGAGIRGLELMGVALEAGAKVAMVCDLYDGHFRRAQELQKNTPTTCDFHEVLARPDIQAVLIATSDHWHAR